MKRFLVQFGWMVVLLLQPVAAALHIDAAGGLSVQSQYRYFDEAPEGSGSQWITFDPIRAFCASARFSADLWKDRYRMGVYGGFMRRYSLQLHTRGAEDDTRDDLGEVLSIPLIAFVEGRHGGFFYEFGLGPYVTRFNYRMDDLPEYSVTSLFGFLFGGGYEYRVTPAVGILLRGELLVNAPVFLVDFLDKRLIETVHASRYPEYNLHEFQTVIYTPTIGLGVLYDFGGNSRIPLEDAVEKMTGLLRTLRLSRKRSDR